MDTDNYFEKSGRLLTLELPYPPVTGNAAVRHAGRGVHYKTEPAKAYERAVDAAVKLGRLTRQIEPQALRGPLVVSWVLAPPDRRARDCDNVRKVVGDALTKAGLWEDDSNKVLVRELFEWTDPVIGGQILLTVEAAA